MKTKDLQDIKNRVKSPILVYLLELLAVLNIFNMCRFFSGTPLDL
jgi:hypothetical protein